MQRESLRLSKPMVSLLARHGITEPTQIQLDIIPAIFDEKDVLAQSETGSGKTLGFALPVIERLNKRDGLSVLTLVPTRELCVQVSGEFIKFSEGKHLSVTSVYGGVSINDQVRKVKTTNIVVATPGRLIDLLERRAINLEGIKYLILDEADRMLDMGFVKDIEKILRYMPATRQTMLFSATVSTDIEHLSKKYLKDPVIVKLDNALKPEYLQQTYYQTTSEEKLPLLIELLQQDRELALVFCNRKHYASRIAKRLSANGVHARSLHGDLSQNQRERVTKEFREGKFTVLVATDVAARGLHIDGITHVYNYEIPRDVESYTHRVGRTARAGQKGEAISLVAGGDEQKFFRDILFTYKGRIQLKSFDKAGLPQLEQSERQPRGTEQTDRGQRNERPGRRPQGTRSGDSSTSTPSRDTYRGEGRSNDQRRTDTRRRSSTGSGSGRPERTERSGRSPRSEQPNRSGRPSRSSQSERPSERRGPGERTGQRERREPGERSNSRSRTERPQEGQRGEQKEAPQSWRKKWQNLLKGKK